MKLDLGFGIWFPSRNHRRAHFMVVGAIMFVCRYRLHGGEANALGVLMGIELVLNGANINFVAFGSELLSRDRPIDLGSTVSSWRCSSSCWPRPKRPWPWRSL